MIESNTAMDEAFQFLVYWMLDCMENQFTSNILYLDCKSWLALELLSATECTLAHGFATLSTSTLNSLQITWLAHSKFKYYISQKAD